VALSIASCTCSAVAALDEGTKHADEATTAVKAYAAIDRIQRSWVDSVTTGVIRKTPVMEIIKSGGTFIHHQIE
jgi:hypothetical protein